MGNIWALAIDRSSTRHRKKKYHKQCIINKHLRQASLVKSIVWCDGVEYTCLVALRKWNVIISNERALFTISIGKIRQQRHNSGSESHWGSWMDELTRRRNKPIRVRRNWKVKHAKQSTRVTRVVSRGYRRMAPNKNADSPRGQRGTSCRKPPFLLSFNS